MTRRSIAAATVAIALAGCGGSGVDRGSVVGLHYYPAHTETGLYPVFGMNCYPVGNSQSCTSYLIGMFPYTDSYPDEWTATLLRCWPKPAHCKTGDVEITHRQFYSLKIGDYLGPPINNGFHAAHKPRVKREKS